MLVNVINREGTPERVVAADNQMVMGYALTPQSDASCRIERGHCVHDPKLGLDVVVEEDLGAAPTLYGALCVAQQLLWQAEDEEK